MRRPNIDAKPTLLSFRRWALFLFGCALSGCYSVQEHRARQFSTDYAALPPEVQNRVQAATIATGDSPKAVYFALGTPNYLHPLTESETEWVYWGLLLAENAEGNPPTLHFSSRGEIRLPRAGEERLELRVLFKDKIVQSWTLGPIDLKSARDGHPLKMGHFPSLP